MFSALRAAPCGCGENDPAGRAQGTWGRDGDGDGDGGGGIDEGGTADLAGGGERRRYMKRNEVKVLRG